MVSSVYKFIKRKLRKILKVIIRLILPTTSIFLQLYQNQSIIFDGLLKVCVVPYSYRKYSVYKARPNYFTLNFGTIVRIVH